MEHVRFFQHSRRGDLTDINEKGLVQLRSADPQGRVLFLSSNWSSQPTLHLVGRRYIDRAYGVVDVKAYNNSAQSAAVGERPRSGGGALHGRAFACGTPCVSCPERTVARDRRYVRDRADGFDALDIFRIDGERSDQSRRYIGLFDQGEHTLRLGLLLQRRRGGLDQSAGYAGVRTERRRRGRSRDLRQLQGGCVRLSRAGTERPLPNHVEV